MLNRQDRDNRKKILSVVAIAVLLTMLASCSYKDRVAPIQLPEAADNMIDVGGLKIAARAFTDSELAAQTFGFDIRKAGLMPVQLTFQNDSSRDVTVNPDQTFLIDEEKNAWPILSKEKTYQRTKNFVDVGETAKGTGKSALLLGAAGAVAGFAIGIVSGNNVGEAMGQGAVIGAAAGTIMGGADAYAKTGRRIRQDLAEKSMQNQPILPGQIAYGALFFPGTPKDEAQTAKELRLALKFAGTVPQIVVLDLSGK
ncbi:MAG: hypothetical protein KKG47_15905 [Proteobacteria bacterium]|nr:hypothetical protein [Pseudomonadota bacterium]MBU1739560.1 hypothetical protein [Pseudomonadota bacterium]